MLSADGRCCRFRSLSADQFPCWELQDKSAHAPHHGECSSCLGSSPRDEGDVEVKLRGAAKLAASPLPLPKVSSAAGMASAMGVLSWDEMNLSSQRFSCHNVCLLSPGSLSQGCNLVQQF